MVNRIRPIAPGNTSQTQEKSSPSSLLSSNRIRPTEQTDDLIVSLAEQYENRRARQVGEWERLYGDNVYRAL